MGVIYNNTVPMWLVTDCINVQDIVPLKPE